MNKKNTYNQNIEKLALRFTAWVGSLSSLVCHTIFFLVCFLIPWFGIGISFDRMLLVLTTAVSLEAIYLGIFIQYSVNRSQEHLKKVQEDVHEIQTDVDEIQEDVQEIQEDVGEIEEDVGEIQEDIDEIQEDVGEIEKDIDEIQTDVDEIEEGEEKESKRDRDLQHTMKNIQVGLNTLMKEIEKLKTDSKK